MKNSLVLLAVVFLIFCLFTNKSAWCQSQETVDRTKKNWEKNNPGKRTYKIEEFLKLLEPADYIMPKARIMTHERWEEIKGATFGAVLVWNKAESAKSLDEFSEEYSHDETIRQMIINNLFTDKTLFDKFVMEHQKTGFYYVWLWKVGWLSFDLIEGRAEKKGIRSVWIPVEPELFQMIEQYRE
jgi:hypothetical protein